MASFTPLSKHLSSLSSTCTFSSSKEYPFCSTCKWTVDSWPEELAAWCWAMRLGRCCLVSKIYKSVYQNKTALLSLCLGVLSLGWTTMSPHCLHDYPYPKLWKPSKNDWCKMVLWTSEPPSTQNKSAIFWTYSYPHPARLWGRNWFTPRTKLPVTNMTILFMQSSAVRNALTFISETKQHLPKRMAQHQTASSSGQDSTVCLL